MTLFIATPMSNNGMWQRPRGNPQGYCQMLAANREIVRRWRSTLCLMTLKRAVVRTLKSGVEKLEAEVGVAGACRCEKGIGIAEQCECVASAFTCDRCGWVVIPYIFTLNLNPSGVPINEP
jgi:hypothetical protein